MEREMRRRKKSRVFLPGHMAKSHVTVIRQDGELLKERNRSNFKGAGHTSVPFLYHKAGLRRHAAIQKLPGGAAAGYGYYNQKTSGGMNYVSI